jgi:hypothetical protein
MISRWYAVDKDSTPGVLRGVDVGSVAGVSMLRFASIFIVEVNTILHRILYTSELDISPAFESKCLGDK